MAKQLSPEERAKLAQEIKLSANKPIEPTIGTIQIAFASKPADLLGEDLRQWLQDCKLQGQRIDFMNFHLEEQAHIYHADRDPLGVAVVTVDGHSLDMRLDLRSHSPTGFEWGYQGSGPAQLSLAILAYEYGDEIAQVWYQTFKRVSVANLPRQGFWFGSSQVVSWLQEAQELYMREQATAAINLIAGGGEEKEHG